MGLKRMIEEGYYFTELLIAIALITSDMDHM